MKKGVEFHNKNGIPKTDITDEMLEDYYKSRALFIKEKTNELHSSTSFDSTKDHKCEYHFRIIEFIKRSIHFINMSCMQQNNFL